ncbi:MAG: ComF family protein [Brevinema sp.]
MLKFIKKFFLHSYCLSCKSFHTDSFYYFCPDCVQSLPLVQDLKNICPICHDSWIINNICQNCNNTPPLWKKLYTIFSYKSSIKKLFQFYKFSDSVLAEKDLVQLLKPHIAQFEHYHFLIVPCSKSTRQRLGFNPVTKIISQITNNYSEALINKSSIPKKSLNRQQRKNTESNIIFYSQKLLSNHNLLIVDDIFTTGSTLHQVSKILYAHQITKFDVLCFFRS